MDAREEWLEELVVEVARLRAAVETLRNGVLTLTTVLAAEREPSPAVLQAYQGVVAELYRGFAGGDPR
jgi:hypothetical protein